MLGAAAGHRERVTYISKSKQLPLPGAKPEPDTRTWDECKAAIRAKYGVKLPERDGLYIGAVWGAE